MIRSTSPALALVLALLVGACAESNSATVVEIPPQDFAQPPPVSGTLQAPTAAPTPALQGEWRGSYQCAQGETDLSLHVERERPKVSAIFEFSHEASGVHGSYAMQGRVEPSGEVTLVPTRWIEQPPGYVMVGMHGLLRGDVFSGAIDNPTCVGFGLRRSH